MKKASVSVAVSTVAVFALFLAGCASSPAPTESPAAMQTPSAVASSPADEKPNVPLTPQPTVTPPAKRTTVIWADYDSGLQAQIDTYTTNQDCGGITTYFGMVTATEADVKARTGHGNEALREYLNESFAIAGCS